MSQFIQRNSLPIVIAIAIAIAVLLPGPGRVMDGCGLSDYFLLGVFFVQGMGLDTRHFLDAGHLTRSFTWGAIVAYILAPLLGYLAMRIMPLDPTYRIGFLLMCCTAPTIVSGIVIAVRSGGELAIALFLTVSLILLGIVATPLTLGWVLTSVSDFPRAALIRKLVYFIGLPSVAGLLFRMWLPRIVQHTAAARQHVPVLLLGLIIYMSLAVQADKIHDLSAWQIASLVIPSALVHGLLLVIAYVLALRLWRLSSPASRSLAFVTSQKSLPVSITVWKAVLAGSHPLAIIAPVIFHPTQIFLDSLASRWWTGRHQPAAQPLEAELRAGA
jgi:predicted Na+-dependent transporter